MIHIMSNGQPAFHGVNVIAMVPVVGSTDRVGVAEWRHSETYGHSYVVFVCGPSDTAEWFSGSYFDASPWTTEREAREAALIRMTDRSGLSKLLDSLNVKDPIG